MILLADGGATKTHWVMFDRQQQFEAETIGISPVHSTPSDHYDELKRIFSSTFPGAPSEIYFYGAGCASSELCESVGGLLSQLYPEAAVHVDSDMLGAARAVLGDTPGIAGILGTGSNSCLYDGNRIADQIPALGYILGDEGSGAILGREVLNRYFKRSMPENLRRQFEQNYEHDLSSVLPRIYQQQKPSRYLATFSRFIADNLQDEYMQELSRKIFRAFFRKNILQYPNSTAYPVGLAGSVAWHYRSVISEVAQNEGFTIKNIIQSPMDGLIQYHIIRTTHPQ